MNNAAKKLQALPELKLSEVIGALSYALDLTEGQPPGHCMRSCYIGMHFAQALKLSNSESHDLYYSLLLKDAGCSSNAERLCELYSTDDRQLKHDFKSVNNANKLELANYLIQHTNLNGGLFNSVKRVLNIVKNGEQIATELIQTRCERGAEICTALGFNDDVAAGVRCLDEHWNGSGKPLKLVGKMIPIYSRIALISQVIDVFNSIGGREAVINEVQSRSGTWFDPELVTIFNEQIDNSHFWQGLQGLDIQRQMQNKNLVPESATVKVNESRLDSIARAFAKIVDAKSEYTSSHSERVAIFSHEIAKLMGFSPERARWIWRAALLHDLGKLSVSNCILNKPGKLTDEEWVVMRKHSELTERILERIAPFKELAIVAGAHHERLDGKGYPKQLSEVEISKETRIITVADVYDALTAARPYRAAMDTKKALEIMSRDRDKAFDSDCLEALIASVKVS